MGASTIMDGMRATDSLRNGNPTTPAAQHQQHHHHEGTSADSGSIISQPIELHA